MGDVYDSIREGIAEDLRKARDYDRMKAELERKLAKAQENPNEDVWRNGFSCGYEAALRRYRGEYPLQESEMWEAFQRKQVGAHNER